jgi:hypothetical protein
MVHREVTNSGSLDQTRRYLYTPASVGGFEADLPGPKPGCPKGCTCDDEYYCSCPARCGGDQGAFDRFLQWAGCLFDLEGC